MKSTAKKIYQFLLILILYSCTTMYRPANEVERAILKQSKIGVTRDDLNSSLGKTDLFGVAGIILEVRKLESENKSEFEIVIDQRDFDWIWDSGGITFKNYYLSPYSDGNILVRVSSDKVENIKKLEIDNMLIVYGRPTTAVNEVIEFNAEYVRALSGFQYGVSGFYYPNRKSQK